MASPRWPLPTASDSLAGFGGGLAWIESLGFCEALASNFGSEAVDYFGVQLFSFVSCEEIRDALVRGFATWASNHARLSFFAATDACAVSDCDALAEIVVVAAANAGGEPLQVTVESNVSAAAVAEITRVTLAFDNSSTTCYYMDSTVCDFVRQVADTLTLPDFLVGQFQTLSGRNMVTDVELWLALLLIRCVIYLPAAFGLAYFANAIYVLCRKSHRAGCENAVYVTASLSHRWRLSMLLLLIPPLLDFRMLAPCTACVAFEVRSPLPCPPHACSLLPFISA